MGRRLKSHFDRAACSRRIFEAIPVQKELADMLDITPSAVSNMKKRGQCSIELVVVASKITGRPLDWFVFGRKKR